MPIFLSFHYYRLVHLQTLPLPMFPLYVLCSVNCTCLLLLSIAFTTVSSVSTSSRLSLISGLADVVALSSATGKSLSQELH